MKADMDDKLTIWRADNVNMESSFGVLDVD